MTHSPLGRVLSLIPVPQSSLQFLILDCPTESTLDFYLQEFQKHNVTHVIRCCQPTYSISKLNEQGIQVHDLPFKDGCVVSYSLFCTLSDSTKTMSLIATIQCCSSMVIYYSISIRARTSDNCCSLCCWFR